MRVCDEMQDENENYQEEIRKLKAGLRLFPLLLQLEMISDQHPPK